MHGAAGAKASRPAHTGWIGVQASRWGQRARRCAWDKAEVSVGQRRADALGLIAESALAADLDRGTAADRYQVVVHVDADSLERDAEPPPPARVLIG